jgi:hypothetical protein
MTGARTLELNRGEDLFCSGIKGFGFLRPGVAVRVVAPVLRGADDVRSSL